MLKFICILTLIALISISSKYYTRVMPLQSACPHHVIGICLICASIEEQKAKIAACTHAWRVIKDLAPGVACDFGLPIHNAGLDGHFCTVCHAIVCNGCFMG